jgi:hypothetical protein
VYQTAKRGFLTTSDLKGRVSGTQVFEDRKPDSIYVLYPITGVSGGFDRYEAGFVCDEIPYIGTLREDFTIADGFDRISARDAMRDAKLRAGWGP